jgi:fatty acid desaturase
VQHAFEYSYWSRKEHWDPTRAALAGSSYYDLPRVAHWFTGNIGYHHIHHLAPRIPNYRLRAAFQSSAQLQSAPRLTLRTSLECARMKVWDEDRGRMTGFPAIDGAGSLRSLRKSLAVWHQRHCRTDSARESAGPDGRKAGDCGFRA